MQTGTFQQRGPPVDTCWSVPVLAALVTLVICLPVSYMGLLFVFFIEDYGMSRAQASWAQNILVVALHVSGLLVGVLQQRISVPNIIVLSTVIATVGLGASAFSRNIVWISATIGAACGLGVGMFLMSACVYILMLFKKYKGTALTMTYLAWGITGIYGPALLTRLREAYGLQGALLMCSATMFHAVPLSLLLRNPSLISFKCFRRGVKATRVLPVPLDEPSSASENSHNENINKDKIRDIRASSRTIKDERDVISSKVGESTQETSGFVAGREKLISSVSTDRRRPATLLSAFGTLLEAPAFYVFLTSTIVGEYSMASFGTTVVDYTTDKGVNLQAAAHLVTYGAVGHILSRIFIVPLSDCAPRCRPALYAGAFAVEAVCTVTMPHLSTMPGIATLRIAETVAQGFVVAVRGILLAHFLGIDKVATCTGLFGLAMIPVSLSSATILGFFRDTMGSYDWFYRTLAVFNAVMAVELCLFFLYNWTRTRRRKAQLCGVVECQPDSEQPLATPTE